ncbi:MAG: PAS domain-containing protein [Rhodospirillales bacterium]|nr:PAS domain-containing protein [Rhodospirillales bacterium]
MAAVFDPADIGSHALRGLYDYWFARRGARTMPRRADIDPMDFPHLLSQVALVEILDDPRVYRWRVVGTWWRDRFGVEATGMWVDDWPFAAQRRAVRRAYDMVAARKAPIVSARETWLDGRRLSLEVLMMPLSENGLDVSMILVALVEI